MWIVEGRWEETPDGVNQETKTSFENRFKEVGGPRMNLDKVPFNSISSGDNTWLCTSFDSQEVKATVWDCESRGIRAQAWMASISSSSKLFGTSWKVMYNGI